LNPDPVPFNLFGVALLAIGALGTAAIFILSHRKRRRKPGAPAALLFTTSRSAPGAWTDLARALLLLLGVVVAAALLLALLPDRTFEGMTRALHSRHARGAQERIALLYLGNASAADAFRIRAVVRNISTAPIDGLDAAIRLYAHDGTLCETVIARTDRETVPPGELARLEVALVGERPEIGAYSVQFKLRGGEALATRDLRKPAAH
jgi:hypothetical protein